MDAASPYTFTEDEAAVEPMKSRIGLAHYATSENCYAQMVKRYKLEGMDSALQRKLMGVRYSMELADFSIANPYTFAEDISTDTMTRIMESAFDLPGIEIDVVPILASTPTPPSRRASWARSARSMQKIGSL